MKNSSREGELTAVFGENGGGIEMDIAERNDESCSGLTVDNAERKRKKREKIKNKNGNFEMHDTEEGKGDESISGPDSGSVSGKESGKEVMEAKKKRKMKRTDIEEGEKDGELIRVHSENCLVNATEKRKKRKQDESKSKENSPENVEDHTQLTNEDGNAKTNHERKKKKKHKKKENYKDDLSASVDGGDIEAESANKGKKRKPSLVVNGSDGTSPRKSNKKVRFSDLNKGRWSQEEYQKLFDLVNTDLQLKVSEEKISKHGMLRDNISRAAISDSLSSRTHDTCCRKWYRQMTSPMVAEGVWADSDDYRMLRGNFIA